MLRTSTRPRPGTGSRGIRVRRSSTDPAASSPLQTQSPAAVPPINSPKPSPRNPSTTSPKCQKDVATARASKSPSQSCPNNPQSATGAPTQPDHKSAETRQTDHRSGNCRRAGSTPGSIVYMFDKSEVTIDDSQGALKSYKDSDTTSGNTIIRQFCSNCGW